MNKYEIIGIVGEGAYGIVYKAKCKETGEFGKLPTYQIYDLVWHASTNIDSDCFIIVTALIDNVF